MLSIDSAVNVANITLSGENTLLAVYNQDFDTSLGGKIYYRESLEESILSRANRDVARTHVTNFTATQSVVVTFVDVTTLLATNETNKFQVVLASDGYDTYAIMTYHRLEILSGLVGYSELNCDWAEFASREISVKLSSTSNIEQTGVHVFPLTTKNCSSVGKFVRLICLSVGWSIGRSVGLSVLLCHIDFMLLDLNTCRIFLLHFQSYIRTA